MPPTFLLQFQEAVLRILPRITFSTLTGLSPCIVFLSRKLQVEKMTVIEVHTPHLHNITITDSVWTGPFSVALTNGISLISFPAGTKTLQFPAFPDHEWSQWEKSHSEISGSTLTFSSPEHIVACHVLHRRFEPSHPSSSVLRRVILTYGSLLWCTIAEFWWMRLDFIRRSIMLNQHRQNMAILKTIGPVNLTRFSGTCFFQLRKSGPIGIRTRDPLLARQVL